MTNPSYDERADRIITRSIIQDNPEILSTLSSTNTPPVYATMNAGGNGIVSSATVYPYPQQYPNPQGKQRGILKVSKEALKELLNLNESTRIIDIFEDASSINIINIIVESENLPKLKQDQAIPVVTKEQLNGYDE